MGNLFEPLLAKWEDDLFVPVSATWDDTYDPTEYPQPVAGTIDPLTLRDTPRITSVLAWEAGALYLREWTVPLARNTYGMAGRFRLFCYTPVIEKGDSDSFAKILLSVQLIFDEGGKPTLCFGAQQLAPMFTRDQLPARKKRLRDFLDFLYLHFFAAGINDILFEPFNEQAAWERQKTPDQQLPDGSIQYGLVGQFEWYTAMMEVFDDFYQARHDTGVNVLKVIAPSNRSDALAYDQYFFDFLVANPTIRRPDGFSIHFYRYGLGPPKDEAWETWMPKRTALLAKYTTKAPDIAALETYLTEGFFTSNHTDIRVKSEYAAAWYVQFLCSETTNMDFHYYLNALYAQEFDAEAGWNGMFCLSSNTTGTHGVYPSTNTFLLWKSMGSKIRTIEMDAGGGMVGGVTDQVGQMIIYNLTNLPYEVTLPLDEARRVGKIDSKNGNAYYWRFIGDLSKPQNQYNDNDRLWLYKLSNPFTDPTTVTSYSATGTPWPNTVPEDDGTTVVTLPGPSVMFLGLPL